MKIPNWFDFVLVVLLLLGMQRGRKRGMSEELLTLLRWMTLVAVCGLLYMPVGLWLGHETVFSQLACYLMAYLGLALGVAVVFSAVKRLMGGKLIGSDAFGNCEYYLAMPAGMIRFGCMLVAGLALLNARYYSPVEIKAMDVYTKDMYGSDFFPTLSLVQREIFQNSFTGPYITEYMAPLMIKPTAPGSTPLRTAGEVLP